MEKPPGYPTPAPGIPSQPASQPRPGQHELSLCPHRPLTWRPRPEPREQPGWHPGLDQEHPVPSTRRTDARQGGWQLCRGCLWGLGTAARAPHHPHIQTCPPRPSPDTAAGEAQHGADEASWTAAGWVGSQQQALQPLAPSRRCLSSGGATGETRRLGWGGGGRSPRPIDSRTMEGPAGFPGSGRSDFVPRLLLLPQRGAVIDCPFQERPERHKRGLAGTPTSQCPGLAPARPPQPAAAQWGLGGSGEASCSLAGGRGQPVSMHTATATPMATHLPTGRPSPTQS